LSSTVSFLSLLGNIFKKFLHLYINSEFSST
jgi:hypothetical protein